MSKFDKQEKIKIVMVLHKMRFLIHRALMYFFLSIASKVKKKKRG